MHISKKISAIFTLLAFFLIPAESIAKEKTSTKNPNEYIAAGTASECPPSGCPIPKKKEPKDDEEYEYEYEQYEEKAYKRIYYTFGLCGSYFIKKADIDIDGVAGAFTNIEFRFAKAIGFGFDSYYGWLMGKGNQYLSTFNPGVKIYPFAYKNPKFEPFLFVGAHVFDSIFGDSSIGRVGMGQGGFAGLGFRMMPENMPLGFEFFTRVSFLYMQRPSNVGGRGLAMPIFAFFGATY